jgi:hypothetical protein
MNSKKGNTGMNRKTFLKNCACGLCSCAAVGLIAPESASGAETKAPDDWRLRFAKSVMRSSWEFFPLGWMKRH